MKIELNEIPVKEVAQGYQDNAENGVIGYSGRLNIRPEFQREFIYKKEQRDEVIKTIMKGFPLNVMYWVKSHDGSYEVMDGQQRTISICQYVKGDFSVNHNFIFNLTQEEQEQILNYKLMIYICDGTDREKLDWFRIINIAGVQLTNQELRNATYTGKWLSESKKYFSKPLCPAYYKAKEYLNGSAIRQDYLETALRWISNRDSIEIEDYMSKHQHDSNCNELWLYFSSVIDWVKILFPITRKEMKGLPWGIYYNKYHQNNYDSGKLESRILELIEDEEITSTSGIYEYLLDGNEKHLNIRSFGIAIKRKVYEKQTELARKNKKSNCPMCAGSSGSNKTKIYPLEKMQADHITPWSQGGKTVLNNCQMLCADCNRKKGNI